MVARENSRSRQGDVVEPQSPRNVTLTAQTDREKLSRIISMAKSLNRVTMGGFAFLGSLSEERGFVPTPAETPTHKKVSQAVLRRVNSALVGFTRPGDGKIGGSGSVSEIRHSDDGTTAKIVTAAHVDNWNGFYLNGRHFRKGVDFTVQSSQEKEGKDLKVVTVKFLSGSPEAQAALKGVTPLRFDPTYKVKPGVNVVLAGLIPDGDRQTQRSLLRGADHARSFGGDSSIVAFTDRGIVGRELSTEEQPSNLKKNFSLNDTSAGSGVSGAPVIVPVYESGKLVDVFNIGPYTATRKLDNGSLVWNAKGDTDGAFQDG